MQKTLVQAKESVAMATRQCLHNELSGKYHRLGKTHFKFVFICLNKQKLFFWGICDGRHHHPVKANHMFHTQNDRPSSSSCVKARLMTASASMLDGSAGCHCRVQANKLKLNVEKNNRDSGPTLLQTRAKSFPSEPHAAGWLGYFKDITQTVRTDFQTFFRLWPEWR